MSQKRAYRLVPIKFPPLVGKLPRIVRKRPCLDEFLHLRSVGSPAFARPPLLVQQLLPLLFDKSPDLGILPTFLHQPEDLVVARKVSDHVPRGVISGTELWPLPHQA